jgi:hypothetical protein
MCDYSLMTVPNRLAEGGEELIIRKFPSGSRGFASLQDLRKANESPIPVRLGFWSALKQKIAGRPGPSIPAVCVPPGARLMLREIPTHHQRDWDIGPFEEATFTEVTASTNTYRDALLFQNGRRVLLQKLDEGQRAKVLDLSSSDAAEPYKEWTEAQPLARR